MQKAFFLALLGTCIIGSMTAQIFTEDFETGDLGQFTAFDLDSNTVSPNENWITSGTWENNPVLLGNNATSTSNYTNAAQPNNWMVSSAITLPNASGLTLYWEESILGGSGESYEILISNTGDQPGDFTANAIYSLNNSTGGPFQKSANLDAYAGQTVYIAFRHYQGTAGYIYIDNIEVTQASTLYDLSVTDIYMNPLQRLEARTIRGQLENLAAAVVTSFDINYRIDGGNIETSAITGVNLHNGNSYEFEHALPWTAPADGNYTIEVWASNINGNSDQVPANDKIQETFTVVTAPAREVLLEVFTSSTCGPCAYYSDLTEPIFSSEPFNGNSDAVNNRLNLIKYHVEIPSPGDPSVNAESDQRRNFYSVTSAPSPFYDGVINGGQTGITSAWELIQAPAKVEMGLTVNSISLGGIDVFVDVTPTEQVSGNYTLHIALVNDAYQYTGQNGQDTFKFAMRKMLPDHNGTTVSSLVQGQMQSFNQTYALSFNNNPAVGSFDFWNDDITVVAFIQNNDTKEILQSASQTFDITSKIAELEETSFGVFPNPAHSVVNIYPTDQKLTQLYMYDALGKLVYQTTFSNQLQVDVSDWSKGFYLVQLTNDTGTKSSMVIID